MRWRKIRSWSLFLVAALLLLGLSWLWVGDLGVVQLWVERWVTEKTGRELRIGDLEIDVGGQIVVVATDVTFANAEGAGPEPLAEVGRAEVHIDLGSLFRGPLLVDYLDVGNVKLRLSRPADASPNWQLDLDPPDTERAPAKTDGGLPFLLREARLAGIELVYDSAERPEPLRVVVDTARQALRDDGHLDLELTGSLSGRAVHVDGDIGTWEALLAGRDLRFDLDVTADTLVVSAAGHIDDLASPRRPAFVFEAAGPNIDDLSAMLGLGDDGNGDIAIAGELSSAAGELMRLDLSGNLGETTIESHAEFTDLADLETIDAELRAAGPDLGLILALAGVLGVEKAPFELVADIERSGPMLRVNKAEMLFADTRFVLTADLPRFPALEDGNMTLDFGGPDLARLRRLTGLPGAASGAFSVEATVRVDAEQREIFEASVTTSLGKLSSSGEILGGDTFIGTTASVEAEVFDVAAAARAWELDLDALPAEVLTANGRIEIVDSGIRTRAPVTARLGQLGISADGIVKLAAGAAGSDILFDASGNRLTAVTGMFVDSPYIPPDPFQLGGRLRIAPGELRFNGLSGTLGPADIGGDFTLRLAPGISGSVLRFSAAGDTFEQSLGYLDELRVRPGAFEITGTLRFAADAIRLETLQLERPNTGLTADIAIGLPLDRKQIKLTVRGDSNDLRDLPSTLDRFEAAAVPFSVDLDAERDGNSIRVDRFDFTVADASLKGRGNLNLGQRLENTRFTLSVDVPNLARLGTIGGRRLSDQAFRFDGIVDGREGALRIDDAELALAESDASGSLIYRPGDTPFLGIDVTSDNLAFSPFLAPDESAAEPVAPQPPSDGRIIPDVAIPFDALAKFNARLALRVARLERRELLLRDVVLDARIEAGALTLNDLSMHARSGFLRARGAIEPADGTGRASLEVLADQLAFGLAPANQSLETTMALNLNVDSTGNDLRALAGNANGIVLVETGGGTVANNRVMTFFYGGLFDEILTTINPFLKSQPTTSFECLILPIRLTNGKLTSRPATLIRTDKLNLTIKPEIDLKSEKLDVSIQSTPRRRLSISAGELINPYIKVTGTMAKPALAVDEEGVLISGGVAVATGGLSVLAKAAWDRLSRSDDPCKTARKEAEEALGGEFTAIEPLPMLPPLPLQAGN